MKEIRVFRRRNWLQRLFGFKTYSVTLITCNPGATDGRCKGEFGRVNVNCPGWCYKNLANHPIEKWVLEALKRDEYVNIPTAKVVK